MKIYKLKEREIHLVGDTVAVVWNLSYMTRIVSTEDGGIVAMTNPTRSGAPYIDFVSIVKIGGELCEDEDSPLDGGISAEYAVTIANELLAAADYLRRVE